MKKLVTPFLFSKYFISVLYMPYIIRKLPNKDLYRVRLKKTGQILAKATTLEKAKRQIKAIEATKHRKY